MMNEISKGKLWNLQYVYLLFLGTLTSTSFSMVSPVITKYATQLGASLTVAGVIAGMFSITALVARPFGGVISDRFNKKRILVIATTVLAIAALGYSFSVNIPLLITFRILHGIGFAISGTANIVLVSSYIPNERIGEGIGYYGLGQIIATAVGPNIGLIIGNTYGFNITFLVSSIILFITAAFMTRIQNEEVISKRDVKLSHNNIRFQDLIATEILPLALIGGIFSLSNGLVSSFLFLVGEKRGIKNIALYFTVNAICLFIVRPVAGKLSDKKGLSFILYPASILTAIESLLLSNANALWIILIAAVCKAFGQGAAQPTIQSACIKKLGLSRSGVATSTFYIGADIGQGIAPIIGGAVASRYGYNVMFYYCAGLFLIAIIAYYFYDKNDKKCLKAYL
jgi:MFS family permease